MENELKYTQKELDERLAIVRVTSSAKAWEDLLCRFSYEARRNLANLLAHEWTVETIGLSSKHNKTKKAQNFIIANKTAFEYFENKDK
jgi:hypothetical protein